MTKRKIDVSEWIPARHCAHILTIRLGRKVRPDAVHRIASRLGFSVHRIDSTHALYLQSEIETITAKDFPQRKRRNQCRGELFHHAHTQQEEDHNEETSDQAQDYQK
jgi:hypothetical protein